MSVQNTLCKNLIGMAPRIAATVGITCAVGLCIEHIWTCWPVQPKILSVEKQTSIKTQYERSLEAVKELRKQLADFYFQPVAGAKKPIQWLSQKEVAEACHIDSSNRKKCLEGFYYHATGFEGLKGILTSKAINVTSEGYNFGAFVATDPESHFGSFLIVLKKNIERQNPPSTFFNHHRALRRSYTWVGFSEKISVNDDTLAYIAVERDVNIPKNLWRELGLTSAMNPDQRVSHYCKWLMEQCKIWTGREILVIPSSETRQYRAQVKEMGQGIPKEWGRREFANRMPTGQLQNSNSVFRPSKGMTKPLSIMNRFWIALNRLLRSTLLN